MEDRLVGNPKNPHILSLREAAEKLYCHRGGKPRLKGPGARAQPFIASRAFPSGFSQCVPVTDGHLWQRWTLDRERLLACKS